MAGYKNDNTHVAKVGKAFEHFCNSKDCKEWGSFGYKLPSGQLWVCRSHKQEGEDALAGRRK